MTTRLSVAVRNSMANSIWTAVDAGPAAGTIKIYTGSQPATPDTAASGTLLATVTLPDPSFATASSGTITGNDPAAVNPVASGTAGWFRVADSTGAAVYDGAVTVTGSGGELQLSNTAIGPGINVDVTALSVTVPT